MCASANGRDFHLLVVIIEVLERKAHQCFTHPIKRLPLATYDEQEIHTHILVYSLCMHYSPFVALIHELLTLQMRALEESGLSTYDM
jgi:hypothetical protein